MSDSRNRTRQLLQQVDDSGFTQRKLPNLSLNDLQIVSDLIADGLFKGTVFAPNQEAVVRLTPKGRDYLASLNANYKPWWRRGAGILVSILVVIIVAWIGYLFGPELGVLGFLGLSEPPV